MTSDYWLVWPHRWTVGETDCSSESVMAEKHSSNLSQSYMCAAQSSKSSPYKSLSQSHIHVIAIAKECKRHCRGGYSNWIPSSKEDPETDHFVTPKPQNCHTPMGWFLPRIPVPQCQAWRQRKRTTCTAPSWLQWGPVSLVVDILPNWGCLWMLALSLNELGTGGSNLPNTNRSLGSSS